MNQSPILFSSERWDVNLIINNQPVPHSDCERLFALCLLWLGRASDIVDKEGKETPESEQYLKCSEELTAVLKLIYGQEKVR